ncbi:hypothetical protein RIF29_20493 [Crotalaria pallida]|uniref:Uncharacterized protein n=1 Tax=Crotalaria pallida TaxID=3830 RepID=A0AAN9F332_CROPI
MLVALQLKTKPTSSASTSTTTHNSTTNTPPLSLPLGYPLTPPSDFTDPFQVPDPSSFHFPPPPSPPFKFSDFDDDNDDWMDTLIPTASTDNNTHNPDFTLFPSSNNNNNPFFTAPTRSSPHSDLNRVFFDSHHLQHHHHQPQPWPTTFPPLYSPKDSRRRRWLLLFTLMNPTLQLRTTHFSNH